MVWPSLGRRDFNACFRVLVEYGGWDQRGRRAGSTWASISALFVECSHRDDETIRRLTKTAIVFQVRHLRGWGPEIGRATYRGHSCHTNHLGSALRPPWPKYI